MEKAYNVTVNHYHSKNGWTHTEHFDTIFECFTAEQYIKYMKKLECPIVCPFGNDGDTLVRIWDTENDRELSNAWVKDF